MNTLAFITTIALFALPALSQETIKPIGAGAGSYQEGSTTTGKFECNANGLSAGITFSDARVDEALVFTAGGTNPNGSNVEYYRVWKNRFGMGIVATHDYYVFEKDPKDPKNPKKFTWKKYWCAGFHQNGTPYGSLLTGVGTVTYP